MRKWVIIGGVIGALFGVLWGEREVSIDGKIFFILFWAILMAFFCMLGALESDIPD